jgi:lipid-binding SYLF domain-containing protein
MRRIVSAVSFGMALMAADLPPHSAVVLLLGPTAASAATSEDERLRDAAEVFRSLRATPDSGIPDKLIRGCRCIAVFPSVYKGAFGFGGRRGHGVISCRDSAGSWSPPSFHTLTGGSFGFQFGVEKTELVLFIMNERGARSLISSQFTLGAQAGVAAGPVGRKAEGATDIRLDAEIYSYAQSKGLFAGISLEGAKVGQDQKAVRNFYGTDVPPARILFERSVPRQPPSILTFTSALP